MKHDLRTTPPDRTLPKPTGPARRPTITDKVAAEAKQLLSLPELDTADLLTLRRYLGNLVAYQSARNARKAAET